MTETRTAFPTAPLHVDAAIEIDRIAAAVTEQVIRMLRRRGVVIGLSGGIDSSVAAALAVRALGRERVLGLLMPEADSSPESLRLGRLIGDQLKIETIVEDITPVLRAVGCYERRDAAIRSAIPEYTADYKSKIVLPDLFEGNGYRVSQVVVESPAGVQRRARLTADAYRTVVAATNFKQRIRTMMEYYHADRLQYAVVGTPNRLEYDQGFFVKNGDGAADLKPLAHLYKTQVYQLAGHLEIPEEICSRPPTTDTYSLAQSQEEFYFAVPYRLLDICLFGRNQGLSTDATAELAGMAEHQVNRVYHDIDSKRHATRYLHLAPLLIE